MILDPLYPKHIGSLFLVLLQLICITLSESYCITVLYCITLSFPSLGLFLRMTFASLQFLMESHCFDML